MSSELLRRAAKVLREHAEAASAGPWNAHPDGLVWAERIGDPVSGSTEVEDANYIALMDPPVALALAELFEATIENLEEFARHFAGSMRDDDLTSTDAAAIAVARAILREPS